MLKITPTILAAVPDGDNGKIGLILELCETPAGRQTPFPAERASLRRFVKTMDWNTAIRILHHIGSGIPLFLAAIAALVLARFVFVRTTSFTADAELFDNPNPAYAIAFGGFLLGAGLALSGTFFGGREEDGLDAVAKLLVEGALVVALLRLSVLINDHFILGSFCITKEISEDRNLGGGFCVAGSSLACGVILNGAMTGYSRGFAQGLRDTILFWLVAQLALTLACAIYRKTMRYDVHRLIEYDDNTAVGVGFGGFLVGMGIVLRSALLHSGAGSLGSELVISGFLALLAAALLVSVNKLVLWLLFPRADYEDEVELNGNAAVAIVAAGAMIAAALFLASIVQRLPPQ